MFKVGDKAVYPAHGVGVIESIQTREVSGSAQRFFTLKIVETGMTIQIPAEKVASGGLRRVIDEDTIPKIYKILRQKTVAVDGQTWNRRFREYSKKIKTGSVFEIAEVLRDLFVLKGGKDLSFGERKMLDTAQNLLVKEISVARRMSEADVLKEFRQIFNA